MNVVRMILVAGVVGVGLALPGAASAAAPVCADPPTVAVRTDHPRIIGHHCTGDGFTYVFAVKTMPTHGTLVGTPSSFGAQQTYTPDPGYTGPDSFTYAVTGSGGESNVVTQALDVTPTANVAPSCNPTTLPGPVERVGTPVDFQFRCQDDDGDVATLDALDPLLHGTLEVVSSSGNLWDLRYTPTSEGTETISLHGDDGHGADFAFTLPDVTVRAADYNTAPTCPSHTETITYAQTTSAGFDCADAEGDAKTLQVTSPPAHGTATIGSFPSGGSFITYRPDDGYVGTDSVGFTATDSFGAVSAEATLTVTVTDLRPPSGCRVDVPAAGVLADRDSDLNLFCQPNDAYPLTYVVDTQPAHGTLTTPCCVASHLVYTPDPGYVGPDSFTWHADGGHSLTSGPQTANIDVVPVTGNTPPQCAPGGPSGPFDMHVDGTVTITFSCTNVEPGDDNQVVVVSPPTHGTLDVSDSDDAHLQVVYTPSATGVDGFDLKVIDGRGGSQPFMHYQPQVKPTDVNGAPICAPGWAAEAPAGYVTWSGCKDPDSDPVTITRVSDPAHGTLTLGPGTLIAYEADAAYAGADTFQLRLQDDHGADDVRTFTVNVRGGGDTGAAIGGGPSGGGSTPPAESAPSASPPSTPAPTPMPTPSAPPVPSRAPAGTALPEVPGLDLGDATARLTSSSMGGVVTVDGSRALSVMTLRCADGCRVMARPSFGKRRGSLQRLNVRAGHAGKVVLRVPSAVRKQLRSGRRKVTYAISVVHADGSVSRGKATFTLRLRR